MKLSVKLQGGERLCAGQIDLWRSQTLCDVTVAVGGEEFQCM